MPNFFTDNDDIRFRFDHSDLAEVASVPEGDFGDAHAGLDHALGGLNCRFASNRK